MPGKYRVTTDTYTGKPFRWNEVVLVGDLLVPGYCGRNDATHLHPSRVPAELLAELNTPTTEKEA